MGYLLAPPSDAMQPRPQGGSGVDLLLQQHVQVTATLVGLTSDLQRRWLEFASAAEARYLPGALDIITRIDHLRSRALDQVIRIAELTRPKVNINARQCAVVVPSLRRGDEAE